MNQYARGISLFLHLFSHLFNTMLVVKIDFQNCFQPQEKKKKKNGSMGPFICIYIPYIYIYAS